RHRSERGREDQPAELCERLLSPPGRPDPVPGPGDHPRGAVRGRAAGCGPHLPEHRALHRRHGPSKPPPRPPPAHPVWAARGRRVLWPGPGGRDRSSGAGGRGHRFSRAGADRARPSGGDPGRPPGPARLPGAGSDPVIRSGAATPAGRAALGSTLPRLLSARAAGASARRVALRYKDRGIWQEVTWQDYQAHARAFGLGLAALGLAPGEKVAILCGNRPEWLYAEVGTLAAGGIAVGVYQDAIAREIGYVIDHADAAYVVAEDQEQLDKVLEVREDLPKVRRIITVDPKGMHRVDDPQVTRFPEVEALGRELDAAHPGRFDDLLLNTAPEDIANIVYTSGTTGSPKGAMLTHRNLINMALTFAEVDPVRPDDQLFSYLPPPWIGEI